MKVTVVRGGSMLTGAVEVYANHSFVLIGSAGVPDIDDWGDGPADADGRHVVVRTRGQVALTRVCLWSGAMPLVGQSVFDGILDLDDYTIFVGDIERIGRWTQRISQTGPQRVLVHVDDPGDASRVNVGLGIGSHVARVPSTCAVDLFEVVTADEDGLPVASQRGLALDGHDSPHARLSAAIALLSPPDPVKPWQEPYQLSGIAEWLRWLGVELSHRTADELASQLGRLVRVARSNPDGQVPPRAAADIAEQILRSAGTGPHVES